MGSTRAELQQELAKTIRSVYVEHKDATDPKVLAGLDVPSNVIVVAAHEPAFARLMAGSRFVAIAIKSTRFASVPTGGDSPVPVRTG